MKARFMISAPQSGGGKTTFTMGLLRALQRRGSVVQPYKCGPGYIDTIFHKWACGNTSVNLDRWLQSEKHLHNLFAHYAKNADACIVEGVMGLYDGFNRMRGSSGEIAAILQLPVILVVNAKATVYSIAPVIYGYRHFNADTNLVGVVFNQVEFPDQMVMLRKACEDVGVECFGYIPRMDGVDLPSHHVGLSLEVNDGIERVINKLADAVEQTVDIDKLLVQTSIKDDKFEEIYLEKKRKHAVEQVGTMKIAMAYDEAFNYVYEDNLNKLKRMGNVVFFSPMRDEVLPEADLVYFPGGYPEFFLKTLSANKSMLESVKRYAENDGRIFAECGGMAYLSRCMVGMDDIVYQLAGVLPMDTTMKNKQIHVGYRKMKLGKEEWYGHECHYFHIMDDSDLVSIGGQSNAKDQPVETKVYKWKNVRAGYTHWYWGERDIMDWWKI